ERGAPVHLAPQELLGLGDLDDHLGAAVLERIGDHALRGVGQARHLPVRVGDALRAAVEVGDRARDLARLEALAAFFPDQQLDPRALRSPFPGLVADLAHAWRSGALLVLD